MDKIIAIIMALFITVTANPHREPEKKNTGVCVQMCPGKRNVHE